MIPKTERFEMRIDEETLQKVDRWRGNQVDVPSRAEAMRRLIDNSLARTSSDGVTLSDGEKLLVCMLRDIYKHLKIDGEIDPEFVGDVLWGGHTWALKWQFSGLYHGHEDDIRDVHFVLDVLAMWDHLERGYEKLKKKDKERMAKEAEAFGRNVKFPGFDGNYEPGQMGIAAFFVEKMGRFERFKGRDFNSHHPTVAGYRRMLAVFKPLRGSLLGSELSADQITVILNAWRHPGSGD